MSKPTGPTNPLLKNIIEEMRTLGYKQKIPFLIKLADELNTPRRSRAEVDLSELNKICKENDIVVVPGKVLGSGILKKRLHVAAVSFSMKAVEQIHKLGGSTMSIGELIKQHPKGSKVRIVV